MKEININLKAYIDDGTLYLSFRRIVSPFSPPSGDLYPIKEYYMIVVKKEHSNIFNLTQGEILLINNENIYKVTFEKNLGGMEYVCNDEFDITSINDSDGVVIDITKEYVVFIYGAYDDKYKLTLNNFDDFLSTPSNISKMI